MTNEEKNKQIMHFVLVDTVKSKAEQEFVRQKILLQKLFPAADIQHVGSTSVPDSLTKGDLDIQVRISEENFLEAIHILEKRYRHNRKNEIWTDGFASFEQYDNPVLPVGIQLTVKDSRYDEFYKMRNLLIKDKSLLKKYNSIKQQCEGKTYAEYRKEKRKFLGANGYSPLLNDD
jgi:GrpB-like predicted nucleotidyltransferase (UPF0157 family)